jgi:hypothetical protein
MRDFTKSMLNCTWALSVFGARQALGLLGAARPGVGKKVSDAFDGVACAAAETFDDSTRAVFRAGESLQNAAIDLMLGGVMFGPINPSQWAKTGVDALQRSAAAAGQTMRQAADAVRTAATNAATPQAGGNPGTRQTPPKSDTAWGWGPTPK